MSRILSFFALCMMVASQSAYAIESVSYFHHDALGSAVAATDETGNLLWTEEYKPYGGRLNREAASAVHNTWYTGKQEGAYGLTYFGTRWYDPELGRFMGVDPVGFKEGDIQSFNRYAYAANNPYKYVDPDGKAVMLLSIFVITAITLLLTASTSSQQSQSNSGYSSRWNSGYSSTSGDDDDNSEVNFQEQPFASSGAMPPPDDNDSNNKNTISKKIHEGQQGKHIPDHNNFIATRSPLNKGINPQKLLDGFHSGKYSTVRNAGGKPVVDFGKTIGTHNGNATRYGIIHSGKKGAHIRPANPTQY